MTISRYIEDDLRARIEAGSKLPYRLTLGALAKHYKVSPTPVRVAIQALIDTGLLVKQSNGRLAIHPAARGEAGMDGGGDLAQAQTSAPVPPRNWRQVIGTDILHRSLDGESGYLREEAMAASYGVSRTVVRQVFNQLVGTGLIEHIPRSGWRIRTFDEADMSDYLVVRETLELKALELAREHLEREVLESMLAGNPEPQPDSPVQLDNRVHQYLVDKANNFYLRDFFDRHGLYYMMLFEQAALEASVVAEMAQQHRELIRALIERDWDAAAAALSQHIRSQRPVMRKLLDLLAERRDAQLAAQEDR